MVDVNRSLRPMPRPDHLNTNAGARAEASFVLPSTQELSFGSGVLADTPLAGTETELRFSDSLPEMFSVSGQSFARFDPSTLNFGSAAPNVEAYTDAILTFEGNQASPAEARQIAESVLAAAEEFNVPPQLLLATLGHESQFDPQANKGNGKGLGQVTRPARQELARISRGGPNGHRARVSDDSFARFRTQSAKDLFASVNNRPNSLLTIEPNVRVSAAYLRLMLDTNRNDVVAALSDYNGAGGAIQRAYPGHVEDTYSEIWDQAMPDQLS